MKENLYQKIACALEEKIRNGTLKTGDKIPSLRMLHREYGVSMTTAVQAYLELEAKGLIISRPQSGYYVSHQPAYLSVPSVSKPSGGTEPIGVETLISKVYSTLSNKDVTRFSLGVPENELLPIAKLNKELVNATRNLQGNGTEYEEIQGNRKLRRDIARLTYTWNGNLNEDDIVTAAGAMNAISFGLMALTQKGDTIAVESPVYFGILQLAKSLGLKVIELPTHPVTGIEPDALKKVLFKIKVCILVSNFNNPLGSCMPDEHKMEVVKMLSERGIPLIEDDLYGDVYFGNSRPKPCKVFDEGLVLWSGSVSKTLAPGYRVGWLAPGKFKDKIVHQKLIHTVSSTTITQETIANFLEKGRYEHHLRKLRSELHANSLQFARAVAEYFPEGSKISQPQGGFMLWVELDKRIDTTELYDLAIRQKISIAPGRMFSLQNQFNNCMRLSYGQRWSEQIDDKLKQLGRIAKGLIV
ncbi:DNA-binding transcriptional regulator, MocR family, contains an aminotransferase domain [Chryseobacterium taeanense]|uniref:DNA-binding transcriptional regulator, MocR family, contains an aminotransferase domain n=1 Tax=Chryseobacterium taeanense TaxID=311334 RepID=A0A1G8MPB7_9FLAO|nr:PLP-dependent aminotransferase family protein [Chryseobacterium taeanense]SDI69869.1 DNA-binding transcriptional regulator, MocR family, contains an aminotransferase domain [Chryseobacterium taeanense]